MPEVGEQLGRYTLLQRLAAGGMGEVYLAAKAGPVGFGPTVALKVLRDELASDQQFVDMIVDEANISMFLNHQNVVSVLDLSEDQGRYYIAMEYVQGITVERLVETLIGEGKKLEISLGLYIASELCRALKYAHTRVNHAGEPLNIIHRDVTPANILISIQGEVKLTDFGIARAKGRIHQTQAGVLKGKFGYMAPEMVRYERIDGRADIFCAGVVIYMMLSGQHPVAGASVMEAIQRYEENQIPPPSSINPEINKALDTIIMRSLAPQPDDRWASAAALGDALQDVILQNASWRRDVQDGAQKLARRIRDVAPHVFGDPVPREIMDKLLQEARKQEEAELARLMPSKPKKHRSGEVPMASTPPRKDSGMITARENDSGVSNEIGQTAPEIPAEEEPPTATGLPAISPDMNFGATPAVSGEQETDESLALADVRGVLQQELGAATDEAMPAASSDEWAVPTEGAGSRPPSNGGVSFPDSSTDRSQLHDDMMNEPVRDDGQRDLLARLGRDRAPSVDYEEGEIANPGNLDADTDDRTMVGGYDEELPSEEDEDVRTVALPALTAELAEKARSDFAERDDDADGKTVAGMSIPDWDEHQMDVEADGSRDGPQVMDVSDFADADDDEARTIVPGQGPENAAGLLDVGDWANEDEELSGDATLLDGLDADDVQAALANARGGSGVGVETVEDGRAAIVRDETEDGAKPIEPANLENKEVDPDAQSSIDMDEIVMDSVQSGRHKAIDPASSPQSPKPLDGPVRIVMGDQNPAGQTDDATSAVSLDDMEVRDPAAVLAESADLQPQRVVQEKTRDQQQQPNQQEEDPNPDFANVSPNLDVGMQTGRWMAGEIDGGSLDWSDEAAARRAVAARTSGPVAAGQQQQQQQQQQQPSPARPSIPPGMLGPGQPGPAQGSAMGMQPGMYPSGVAPQVAPEERGFFERNWMLFLILFVAVGLFGGLFYVWSFTDWFWPKLKLSTEPPGATVIIDDAEVSGRTPLVVRVAPENRHRILFRRQGFKKAEREITEGIGRGRTYTLQVTLQQQPAKLLMQVSAKVFVNEAPAGEGTSVELRDLPLDKPVKIRVEAEGHKPYEVTFPKGADVPSSFDVPLQKK